CSRPSRSSASSRRRTSVTRGAPSISLRHGATSLPSVVPVQFRPVLVTHAAVPAETTAPKRTRLWEFNTNLHCSIVGTCLSTGELRQIVTKLGLATPSSTDHELHGTAVLLASRHDAAACKTAVPCNSWSVDDGVASPSLVTI